MLFRQVGDVGVGGLGDPQPKQAAHRGGSPDGSDDDAMLRNVVCAVAVAVVPRCSVRKDRHHAWCAPRRAACVVRYLLSARLVVRAAAVR
jgi:hypothetical protein